ncbi:MAG: hypothetical protein DWQ05_10820 [Calditrichaeota bacterium]|nr:MAG: hypothetical protein DWQ05_10820 [Calditrichota bacterium]
MNLTNIFLSCIFVISLFYKADIHAYRSASAHSVKSESKALFAAEFQMGNVSQNEKQQFSSEAYLQNNLLPEIELINDNVCVKQGAF